MQLTDETWIQRVNWTWLAAGFLGLFCVIYGPYFVDVTVAPGLFRDPFTPPEHPLAQYLMSSFLIYFIGHGLHADKLSNFILLFFGLFAAMVGLVWLYLQRRFGDARSRLAAFLLLSISPFWLVGVSWLGNSTVTVIALYVALLLAPGRILPGLIAAALICAHREQGVIILVLHVLLRQPDRWTLVSLAIGTGAGLGLAALYFANLTAPVYDRRALTLYYVGDALRFNFAQPASLILLSLNWFWLVIGFAWLARMLTWRDGLALMSGLGVTFLMSDNTRVALLVSMPLIFSLIERVATRAGPEVMKVAPLLLILGLVQAQRLGFNDGAPRVRDVNWIHTVEVIQSFRSGAGYVAR